MLKHSCKYNVDIDRRSVCCTIVEAMKRIATAVNMNVDTDGDSFTLHFLGAEDLEFESFMNIGNIASSYEVLFKSVMEIGVKHLSISFIGPNLLGRDPPLNRIETSYYDMTVSIDCHSCLYHDYFNAKRSVGVTIIPHMVLMLNAGIWGYTSWLPTLEVFALISSSCGYPDASVSNEGAHSPRETSSRTACRTSSRCSSGSSSNSSSSRSSKILDERRPLFIVTSYTLEEAEDDEDTIREHFLEAARRDSAQSTLKNHTLFCGETDGARTDRIMAPNWLWEAEINPHKSSIPIDRRTKVDGREYYSNHAWQCFEIVFI